MTPEHPTLHECAHAFMVDELQAMEPGEEVVVGTSTFLLAFGSVERFKREFRAFGCWEDRAGRFRVISPMTTPF